MILLTGANGFLGKIIFEYSNEKIYTLGRSSNLDLSIDLSKDIPIFPKVDLVIHSAGKAHSVPKTDAEKKEFYDVNVLGTLNLLKGLEKSGLPEKFVFISSVSVYGQEIGNNISEEHSLLAKDPYGLSKIEAEQLVEKWCDKNQVICTILRLPLLVGKKPPGNLGAMIKAIKKGYYFNIGGGVAKKSMVLAKDVASFISIVAPVGGIYNLTDGYHPSFGELSLAISKNKKEQFSLPIYGAKFIGIMGDFLGNKAPINSLKVKKITSDLTFDDSKAREVLNWKPQSILEYLKKENLD
jgi:nucleoside-diphosphate-sugar epimerase